MSQKQFLTFAAFIACSIGSIALFFPMILLVEMKAATASGAALVMARTAGAFLLGVGILNFMVRADSASPTMVSILFANAMIQLFILPIDPIAYFTGVYGNPMSFIPNTILHIGLLFGFAHFWRKTKTEIAANHAKIA
ncbi:MAG: hypothetical protein ACRBB0_08600 [Pelagimonas sp.]|uniref:hypothetical protein n=1 Tax=Pelagimonas sp. TaxID=2073170 RepID=UPI003D6A0387